MILVYFALFFRGNSKYHYYGIRIKPSSPLNSILVPLEEGSSPVSRSGASKRYKFMKNDGNAGSGGVNGGGAGGGGGGGGAGANESFSSDQNNSSNHAFTPQVNFIAVYSYFVPFFAHWSQISQWSKSKTTYFHCGV